MASASKKSRSPEAPERGADGASAATASGSPREKGKQGPTPTRREREQQNARPLVPADRKAARKEAQARVRAQQAEAREGAARGDDRYLRESERGPQKRFLRDRVDARFMLGELLIPLMVVVIFANFFLPQRILAPGEVPWQEILVMASVWVWVIAAIIDGWLVARGTKARIAAVVGEDRVESGIIWGTIMRGLQMRFMRMPKPQVPRFSNPAYTGR